MISVRDFPSQQPIHACAEIHDSTPRPVVQKKIFLCIKNAVFYFTDGISLEQSRYKAEIIMLFAQNGKILFRKIAREKKESP